MITAKIDTRKILKEHLYKGEKGTYLDIAIFPNRDGKNEYGDDYYIVQSLSKEAREKGEKGPIIGNARNRDMGPKKPSQPKAATPAAPKPADPATPQAPDPDEPF